jgi:hypothetical protein
MNDVISLSSGRRSSFVVRRSGIGLRLPRARTLPSQIDPDRLKISAPSRDFSLDGFGKCQIFDTERRMFVTTG